MAGSLRRLGGGEKRVKQKLEIARRHTSGVTSQSSDFSSHCDLAIPVSFLCLAGPCLAGVGPAWKPACSARGLNGRGLAGGWLAGDLPAAARLGPGRRHTAHSTHSQNSQLSMSITCEDKHSAHGATFVSSKTRAPTTESWLSPNPGIALITRVYGIALTMRF